METCVSQLGYNALDKEIFNEKLIQMLLYVHANFDFLYSYGLASSYGYTPILKHTRV